MDRRFLRHVILPLLVLALLASPFSSMGEEVSATESQTEERFNPTDLIFSHLSDSYEWHIFSLGETHVSLPLPIILYSRAQRKPFLFLSSKFHHGEGVYKNFQVRIPEGGGTPYIVELDPSSGEVLEPSPLDFSIKKNVLSVFIVCILMIWMFLSVAKRYKTEKPVAPRGVQNLIEPVILFVRDDIVIPSIGREKGERFMPFLMTLFFFILINNLVGLIPIFPGGANVTGNITVTMVLAIFTFLMTTFHGNKHYWRDIVDSPGVPIFLKLPIPIMPVVEIASMFTKPVVLMIRLFANMLAGHLITLVFISLIFLFGSLNIWMGFAISPFSVAFGIFMTLLDVLVSVVQAYVFTLLSAIYIGMAVHDPTAESVGH